MAKDRLLALLDNQESFTGIDFVQVVDTCDQTVLRVYFLTDLNQLDPPFDESHNGSSAAPLRPQDIIIYRAERGHRVPSKSDIPLIEETEIDSATTLVPLSWDIDTAIDRQYLEITVKYPGDFAKYKLRINDPLYSPTGGSGTLAHPRVDHFFNDIEFSFKVGCNDALDCQEPSLECPLEEQVDFPVDYLARDFVSLRNALLDFAAQRYPQWTLPVEADLGSVLMEVMAAFGDELSYIQDRYNREVYLETATQRRSLRKKARLMDYEIHDGRLATTFLELVVDEDGIVEVGRRAYALSETNPPVPFEVGEGLVQSKQPEAVLEYPVRIAWNREELSPYIFDDTELCLPIGAMDIYIAGSLLPNWEPPDWETPEENIFIGRWMLLRTDPDDPSLPARRHIVKIKAVEPLDDPLFAEGAEITKVSWDKEYALPFQFSLSEDDDHPSLCLNVVPAIAGQSNTVHIKCGEEVDPENDPEGTVRAVEREGPLHAVTNQRAIIYLAGLPDTGTEGLGFFAQEPDASEPERNAVPEVWVTEQDAMPPDDVWQWRRDLIGEPPDAKRFTLEDGVWERVVAYWRQGAEVVHQDYATGNGFSLRFGDGEFGLTPSRGTIFEVEYRFGCGTRANLLANTITAQERFDPENEIPSQDKAMDLAQLGFVKEVSNPFEVTNGSDPESAKDIKVLTPEAYQAESYFAVRPEDYGRQSERLDWVQRARGTFRWTGSWHTALVAADPLDAHKMSDAQRADLMSHLDCVRQAGREVMVYQPKYLDIDLEIVICVAPYAYPAEVKAQVLERLMGRGGFYPIKGFFHPDNFTFGTPLRRTVLESVIHDVDGVQSVLEMHIRERGHPEYRDFIELSLEVAPYQVIRLENDPNRPERGVLKIISHEDTLSQLKC